MISKHLYLTMILAALPLVRTPSLSGGDQDIQTLAAHIDQCIAAAWGKDLKPAPLADDAEFFRRVHLDLAGRIPSITETRDFLDDNRPQKRGLWVERILRADRDDPSYSDAYSNHFANVWRAWLMSQTNLRALFQLSELEVWLRQRLKANIGYDQMVRELLTQELVGRPTGSGTGTAAAFYLANDLLPESLAATTARLFLGVKLECAQCHKHPFAQWKREQFWEYAAFFTDVPLSVRLNQVEMSDPRKGIKITGTDKVVKARFLDGTEPKWKDEKTRPTLVEWMTAANNPYFARAAVNRLWAYFFGVSLVEQLDGPLDEENANHAALLKELARAFASHQYDMKFLIRAIVTSQTYQRTSRVSHARQREPKLFARMPLRGLSAEQLFDSLAIATECQDIARAEPRDSFFVGSQSPRNQLAVKFPNQDQKTEYQTSILQALYMMNSEFITRQTSLRQNPTLATLAEQRTDTARKLESLYLVVLSRQPRPEECERFVKYIDGGGAAGDAKQALADVFWILLNSPEFLLNH